MDAAAIAILLTLVAYNILLLALGLWAQRRTRDATDFFLGGRGLGPVVAAISASASSSSAWTLIGVSGYAFASGLSAIWILPACVGGFALNWYLLARRLRELSARTGALTVTELLAGPRDRACHRAITVTASVIVLFSLLVYVASQFQGAGKTFAETFDMSSTASVLVGASIVVAYTLLGGFWAVSVTDTLQGLVMVATAVALPLAALVNVGGADALADGIAAIGDESFRSWTGSFTGAAAIGLVLGFLGIGLGYPGQPHVVNRFMAIRDDASVTTGARIAMLWAVTVYSGMILLGLCGRVLFDGVLADQENVLVATAQRLCHPIVAGIMIAAVLSAIMSTADSQLLVAASAVSHDLGSGSASAMLARSRLVVLALSAAAVVAALWISPDIFSSVLFAWTAMGAAFGPLLLWTVWRGAVPPRTTLVAIVTGFSLSVAAHAVDIGAPDKSVLERIVPFVVATAVIIVGTRFERAPRSDY